MGGEGGREGGKEDMRGVYCKMRRWIGERGYKKEDEEGREGRRTYRHAAKGVVESVETQAGHGTQTEDQEGEEGGREEHTEKTYRHAAKGMIESAETQAGHCTQEEGENGSILGVINVGMEPV